MKQEIITQFLGDLTKVTIIVSYAFAFLGIFLRWWFKTAKGIKTNEESPAKFNLKYWIFNNLPHKVGGIVATFAIVFISLRFSNEIFGQVVSYFFAFGVGLSLDFVADKLKGLIFKK